MGKISLSPKIVLSPPKKPLPAPLRVLTSPKTTLALGTIVSFAVAPTATGRFALGAAKSLMPKTALGAAKAAIAVPVITGLAMTSKTVRGLISPQSGFKRGKEIGQIIDDPSKLVPRDKETIGGKIKDVATKAGLLGGAAAVGVGTVVGVTRAAKKVKEKVPKIPFIGRAQKPTISRKEVAPTIISPQLQPVTVPKAQPVEPLKEPEKQKLSTPTINNKITVRPEINVRINQSKKFINQSNVIRR